MHRPTRIAAVMFFALSMTRPAWAVPSNLDVGDLLPDSRGLLYSGPNLADLRPVLVDIERGNLAAAREAIDRLLEQAPRNSAILEVSGLLYALAGDLSRAERDLSRAVSLDADRLSAAGKLGAVQYAAGRSDEARATFDTVLARAPNDLLANRYMGRLAVDEQRIPEAIRYYERGLSKASTGYTPVHLELADLYNRADRPEATIRTLAPSVADGVRRPEVLSRLAGAYVDLGDPVLAASAIDLLRNVDPDSAALPLLDAVLARLQGRLADSEQALAAILAASPEDTRARYQLGLTLAAAGRWQDAARELLAAAEGRDDGATPRLLAARLLAANGDTEGALALLRPMADGEAAPTSVLQVLFAVLLRAGLEEEARERLADIQNRFPESIAHRVLAVRTLASMQTEAKAAAAAAQLTRDFPASALAWRVRAGVADEAGDAALARSLLAEGLVVTGRSPALLYDLALLQQRDGNGNGNGKDAVALYREVLQADPDQIGSLNNLAALLAGDDSSRSEAIVLARRAHELRPGSPQIADTLGWTLHLHDRSEEALPLLRFATERVPGNGAIVCHYGIVLAANGDATARETLRRCLGLAPTAALASQANDALDAL